MSNKCSVTWCYLPKYQFNFGLDEEFIEAFPALNIALCALSQILTNNHLMMNFSTHFIPFDEYTGIFPTDISESVRNRIKNIFTQTNLPSIIFQDEELTASIPRAIYGCYVGKEKETDTEIIYINKQLIECSKMNNHPTDVIRYGAVLLFSILHELGHWSFHHFACNMDHDLATPKGVLMEEAGDAIEFLLFGFRIQHYGPEHPKLMIDEIVTKFNRSYRIIPLDYLKSLFEESTYINVKDHLSIKISVKKLREAVVIHEEELQKFNFKRIFNPVDEPTLQLATTDTYIPTGKRIFDPRDKNY